MSKPLQIWVTGANGQIGSELQVLSKNSAHHFIFTSRDDVDLAQPTAIEEAFDRIHPDVVINCAAYTAVDKAEDQPDLCHQINAHAVKLIAQGCKANDCTLIHFSSDYIYHIDTDVPLAETDIPEPKGQYAKSKLQGEREIQMHMPDHFAIIRTSWVYSSFGNNFVKTMMRLGRDRDELQIVADQIGAPTYARDLAILAMDMIPHLRERRVEHAGVYNYSNQGRLSWFDFAKKIFELEEISCMVKTTTTEAFGAKAPRPAWSVMNSSKIQRHFGLTIPHWEDSLKECLILLATK